MLGVSYGAMKVSKRIEDALKALSEAMQADEDYAWSWHCNIAMNAVDAGAPHRAANERAADFMWGLFGVNTRKSRHWNF